MGFKELELKAFYDSDLDDLLEGFYIPVMSEARMYHRLAGFFSSTALAIAARGISKFIQNGGKMELVASANLSDQDVEAIRAGKANPGKVIADAGIREIEGITEPFIWDHVRALAWLVAKGRLTVRIAIPLDEFEIPMDARRIEKEGLFHHKIAVFTDQTGDTISFNGSINETSRAWTRNGESFHVFRSWEPKEEEHLKGDVQSLRRYMDGKARRMRIIEVPEMLKASLLGIAPMDIAEIDLSRYERRHASVKDLRDYQVSAMNAWLFGPDKTARRRGILEMATGTGKTWIAAACLKALDEDPASTTLLSVIAVPYKHLVPQWREELEKWQFAEVQEVHGEVRDWGESLANLCLSLRLGHKKRGIVLTTHDTLTSDKFIAVMRENDFGMFLVADEVHAVGSELRRERLLENFTYRMGLSATPERYFDDAGTNALQEYFGEAVFKLPLKEAIERKILSPYEYYPRIVELGEDEMQRYIELTRKYAAAASRDSETGELELLFLFERAKVVESARAKFVALSSLISTLPQLDRCLIFVTERQIGTVTTILASARVVYHNFTEWEDLEKRTSILSLFAKGDYQALVAMKCLDEGVDVPSARQAIIMASTGNPRQFIQRRGRVLRKDPASGKTRAQIWDFVVVPKLRPDSNASYFAMERRVLEHQLRRVEEFAAASTNPVDTTLAITDIKLAYRIA